MAPKKNQEQGSDDVDETLDDELDTQDDADENDDADNDEQDSENDDTDDDDTGFEGEFDPKRARRTIDRLRGELKAEKAKKVGPKDTAETKRLSTENLRLRVALKAGLDDDLADRLRGETEDELLADAQKLLDRFYPEDKKKPALQTRQPQTRLKGGTKPNEEPELTADQLVKKALEQ